MKIVIAPDSYKGSLSALQVADVIASAFTDVWKDAGRNGTEAGELDLVKAPMADGGEGTVDSLVGATGGRRVAITVSGPLGKPVEAFYGVLADGETAVLEVANICGLPMLAKHERDPEQTTSAGLGEAIRTVLDAGYRKLIVGLGGSACNDGGLGMLQALGGIFLDTTGRPVSPTGKGVTQVSTVCMDSVDKRLAECDIRIASDVDNPLCGPEGASFVFGPQKGASEEQMRRLDAALAEYAKRVEAACGRSSADESYAA
ncbi:MAG: glycerate kinase [Alicyclobacillus herbarius]|nr:glycerate kinase [Alicyclobacillus herbarius]